MKKFIISGLIAGSLFAFPGMMGGSMSSNAGMLGKPLPNLKDNTVVAKINGKKVTVKEINAYLQGITGDNRIRLQDLPAQHVEKLVKNYADTLTFYQKAKSIENTPQFKAAKMKLAVDMWLKNRFNEIKISDKEAKEFYEKNKDTFFKTAPQIKARHILVKDEKLAKKLINELKGLKGKALEEKFAELAKKYSIGPSKVQGGELGWFNPKQMVPEFAEAAKKLKVGEITLTPVKTRFGYHIILVEDKKSNSYITFEKVKPQIIGYLKQQKLKKELENLQKQEKVQILVK